jgi:hypothetical protein
VAPNHANNFVMSLRAALRHLQLGDWEEAHSIAQDDESSLGCWAHGIVHLQEGDTSNARYWYGRAQREFPEPVEIAKEISALAAALGEE